jgi:hypothetical protein
LDRIKAFLKLCSNRKYIVPLIAVLLVGILFYCRYTHYISSDGDANFYALLLSAVIILWYTYETSEMAQASRENLKRQKRPSVVYEVYQHPQLKSQSRFKIANLSDYPLAARIKCNFKVNNRPVDFSDAYNGKRYWNLQLNESKSGHFSWVELHEKVGLIREVDLKTYKSFLHLEGKNEFAMKLKNDFYSEKLPPLTMDVEIYCENQMGAYSYYPPSHYDYDYVRDTWVPILESDKPYWEFDLKPEWVLNSKD